MKKDIKKIKIENKFSRLVYFVTTISLFLILVFSPKQILEYEDGIEIAYSLSSLNDENILFYDYKVYSTQDRFEKGLNEDVLKQLKEFKDRNEFMVIKINGTTDKTYLNDEYLIIENDEVPELNIEYYLLRDLEIQQIRLPNRTFLVLFEDISNIINTIYLGLFILFVFLTLPSSLLKTIGGNYFLLPQKELDFAENQEKIDENK